MWVLLIFRVPTFCICIEKFHVIINRCVFSGCGIDVTDHEHLFPVVHQ